MPLSRVFEPWGFFQLVAVDILFAAAALAWRRQQPEARHGFWLAGQAVLTAGALAITVADEFAPAWGPLPVHALMATRWLNLNSTLLPLLILAIASHWLHSRLPPRRLALALGILAATVTVWTYRPNRDPWGADAEFLARAGQRPGMLLVAPGTSPWPQLRTRRAVLDLELLDTLPYAPQAGPRFERVLNQLYGATLLDPGGSDQLEGLEALWGERPPREWNRLGTVFGFTDVLVPGDWILTLPIVERTENMVLYHVPRS